MPLTVAVQMDDIASINIESDTTFVLAMEAQKRGYKLYYYLPSDMTCLNGKIYANVYPLILCNKPGDYYTLGNAEFTELSNFDVILMRQDPPFNMDYLTYTYLLETIHPKTFVVNNPAEVRNAPEKMLVNQFTEFMTDNLISKCKEQIIDFIIQHQDVVIKPLYSHGGQNIIHIKLPMPDLAQQIDKYLESQNEPIVVQQFINEVYEGDKRIILIDGKPEGAILRVPEKGSFLSNMVQGGNALKTSLTKREKQICKKLGPVLKKRGLILAGIDVINGYLTEINVTSPTGIQAINKLDNTCLEAIFWDRVEKYI